eukprot:GILI01019699.1.p1 GENE.GILI01019699.1~~GILI01019699.1.p1  ORF type:complete len:298 (-),score=48.55 GILI01019699.1:29-922(-)
MEEDNASDQVQYFSNDFEWDYVREIGEKFLAECDSRPRHPTNDQDDEEDVVKSFEEKSRSSWDVFHGHNVGKFFKDRHYLGHEFQELVNSRPQISPDSSTSPSSPLVHFLECGCGTGNTVFPLLKLNPSLFAHAFDFSSNAVEVLKQHPQYSPDRCNAFVCDLVTESLPSSVPSNSLDFCTMIFFLSALTPSMMALALSKVHQAMKPGGVVFVRDYGLYDLAMLRSHKKGSKLADRLYSRGDGTLAYYFSLDVLREVFEGAGFREVESKYCTVRNVNRKTGQELHRVWVHGKFVAIK